MDWTNLVAGVYRASVTFDSYDELEEEDEEDNVGAIPFAIRDPLSLSEGLRCANLVFSTRAYQIDILHSRGNLIKEFFLRNPIKLVPVKWYVLRWYLLLLVRH